MARPLKPQPPFLSRIKCNSSSDPYFISSLGAISNSVGIKQLTGIKEVNANTAYLENLTLRTNIIPAVVPVNRSTLVEPTPPREFASIPNLASIPGLSNYINSGAAGTVDLMKDEFFSSFVVKNFNFALSSSISIKLISFLAASAKIKEYVVDKYGYKTYYKLIDVLDGGFSLELMGPASTVFQVSCTGQVNLFSQTGVYTALGLNSRLYDVDILEITSKVLYKVQVYVGYVNEPSYILYKDHKYFLQEPLLI